MAKTVTKLMFNMGEISRSEAWLQDMAKRGLHLESANSVAVKFAKEEPRNVKYRLIYREEPDSKEKANHLARGWKYICNWGRSRFSVFVSLNESVGEFYQDKGDELEDLVDLSKTLKYRSILCVGLVVFCILMLVVGMPSRSLYDFIAGGGYIYLTGCALICLYLSIEVVLSYLSVRKKCENISNSKPDVPPLDWQKYRLRSILSTLLICGFIVLFGFIGFGFEKNVSLPEGDVDFPCVRLMDIEAHPTLRRESGLDNNGVDWSNRITSKKSLFTKKHVITREYSAIGETDADKENVSMKNEYIELTFPQMADRLVDEILSQQMYKESMQAEPVTDTNLERLEMMDFEGSKYLVGTYQGKVLAISYYGKGDMTDLIRIFEEEILAA